MVSHARGEGALAPPHDATSAAAFIGALREMKQWSGFTYRELQRRAQAAGDLLPYSTSASALGRSTLPREELVRSFVRACGADETTVEAWLAIRRRIATESVREAGGDDGGNAVPAEGEPVPAEGEPVPAEGEPAATAEGNADLPAGPEDDHAHGRNVEGTAGDPPSAPEASTVVVPAGDAEPIGGDQPGDGDELWPTTGEDNGRLAAATAADNRYRWVGIHRHDPADDVPRPAGLRWLIPPVVYRIGWVSRVLAGVLGLLLVLAAGGVIARAVRDTSASTGAGPSGDIAQRPAGLPAAIESTDRPTDSPTATATATTPIAPTAAAPHPAPTSAAARRADTGTAGAGAVKRPATTRAAAPPPAAAPKPSLSASGRVECTDYSRGWGVSISGGVSNTSATIGSARISYDSDQNGPASSSSTVSLSHSGRSLSGNIPATSGWEFVGGSHVSWTVTVTLTDGKVVTDSGSNNYSCG